jgi:hypothetical protein
MMKKIFLATIATIALASISVSIHAVSFFTRDNQVNTTLSIQNNYGYTLNVQMLNKKTKVTETVKLKDGDRLPCGNICLYEREYELLISTQTSITFTDLKRFVDPFLPQLRGKANAIIIIQPSGIREDWKIGMGFED